MLLPLDRIFDRNLNRGWENSFVTLSMTSIKIEPRTKIWYANTFKKTRRLCWRIIIWANKQIRHVCCTKRTTQSENNAIKLYSWDAAHISRRQSRHDVLQMCERYSARDLHWQLIFILIVYSGGGQSENCVPFFHLSFSAFADSSARISPSAFASWNKQIFHSKFSAKSSTGRVHEKTTTATTDIIERKQWRRREREKKEKT